MATTTRRTSAVLPVPCTLVLLTCLGWLGCASPAAMLSAEEFRGYLSSPGRIFAPVTIHSAGPVSNRWTGEWRFSRQGRFDFLVTDAAARSGKPRQYGGSYDIVDADGSQVVRCTFSLWGEPAAVALGAQLPDTSDDVGVDNTWILWPSLEPQVQMSKVHDALRIDGVYYIHGPLVGDGPLTREEGPSRPDGMLYRARPLRSSVKGGHLRWSLDRPRGPRTR